MLLVVQFTLYCLSATAQAQTAQSPLSIETTWFRAAVSSKAIQEAEPKLDALGGTLHLLVRNKGAKPLTIDGFQVQGVAAETLIAKGEMNWWRAMPRVVPAGGASLVSLNASSKLFAKGRTVVARVYAGELSAPLSMTLSQWPSYTPGLAVSHTLFEGSTCIVFVRNDSPQYIYEISEIVLEGVQTGEPTYLRKTVDPGEVTIVKFPLNGATPKEPAILRMNFHPARQQAETNLGDAALKAVAATGALVHSLPVRFPIGSTDATVWKEEKALAELAQNGVDLLPWNANAKEQEGASEYVVFQRLASQYGIRALTSQGYEQVNELFLRRRNGDPHIAAATVKDKADLDKEKKEGVPPVFLFATAASLMRRAAPETPIHAQLVRSRRFGEFAPFLDVLSYQAPRVGAPHQDRWPKSWGGLLETARDYAWDAKRNAEPAPVWAIAQGPTPAVDLCWVDGKPGRGVPTPDEIKAQLYFQLGRGVKGVIWQTVTDAEAKRMYEEELPNNPATKRLSAEERGKLIDTLIAQVGETRQAMWNLNREVNALRDLLGRSEPAFIGQVDNASKLEKVDMATVVGERAVIAFITNFDYEMLPAGYHFKPQASVQFRIKCPAWMKSTEAFWVGADGIEPAKPARDARTLHFELPELPVGRILVITADPTLRAEIEKRLAAPGGPAAPKSESR